MTIHVRSGLIWKIINGLEHLIGTIEGDKIANQNQLVYVERFVQQYEGNILELDENLKII